MMPKGMSNKQKASISLSWAHCELDTLKKFTVKKICTIKCCHNSLFHWFGPDIYILADSNKTIVLNSYLCYSQYWSIQVSNIDNKIWYQ